jgi:AcrR family transcriptional regulator
VTPRAGLDREAVVEAAARLADEEGLHAVTLARLATELGVRPPSLYVHVGGLADLRRRLGARGARALADELRAAAAGRAGRDALAAIARAYRDYALRHPGSYEALQLPARGEGADGGEEADAAAQVVGVVLAVLRGYQLEGDDAIHAVRIVRSSLHGFVTLERAGGFQIPLALDETFGRLVTMLDRGLRAGLT